MGESYESELANGPLGKIFYLMVNIGGGGSLDAFVMLNQLDIFVSERETQLLEFAYLVPFSQ